MQLYVKGKFFPISCVYKNNLLRMRSDDCENIRFIQEILNICSANAILIKIT